MQEQAAVEKALRRRYPEAVALVISASGDGRPNVMAVGWITLASSDPWMFALGVDEGAYTYRLLRRSREFVVAFPSEAMARETLFVGTHSGRNVDKFAITRLRTQPAVVVRAPLLADAVANFECRLRRVVRPGDCPILFGEVMAAHVNVNPRLRRLYNWGRNYTLTGVCRPDARRLRSRAATKRPDHE